MKPTASLVSAQAADCSLIAEWSEEIGWDVLYQQVGVGGFSARFSAALCGNLLVTNQHCNRELAIRGAPPLDTVPIILVSGAAPGVFQGQELQVSDALVMRPGTEGNLASPRDLNLVTVSVPRVALERALRIEGHSGIDSVIPTSGRLGSASKSSETRRFRHLVRRVFEEVEPGSRSLREDELEDRIVTAAAALLVSRSVSAASDSLRNRGRYVRKAQDFVEAHLERAIRLSDVAAVVGISQRTLELAFREVLGMTPVAYIRNRRLNRVRRRLLLGPDAVRSVTDAAMECGFSHLGHFSRRYKELFNELPSETFLGVGATVLAEERMGSSVASSPRGLHV